MKPLSLTTVKKVQYLTLDDPERSVNWKLTKRPITFYCSVNLRHPAIYRAQPLISGVLVFFFFLNMIYTPCYISSDEKGLESAAWKQDRIADDKLYT